MLSKEEIDALVRWYHEPELLAQARKLVERQSWEELEEYLHMTCLFPLSRHSELPDYMRNEEGKPRFPTNLNPKKDLEKWQDAIEIGWDMVREQFSLTHDEIHRHVAREQRQDWDAFMESVEQRKKERGDG